MATRLKHDDDDAPRRPPALTPEGRENQLIASAYDLAEQQIHSGSASSQVISHFLKLGSTRERLEQERLALDNHWTQAKIDALASQARVEEMYKEAMDAFRSYAGQDDVVQEEYYDD